MSRGDQDGLEIGDLPDVTSTSLSHLLRRDAKVESAIRDLVAHLREDPEVMFAWNNYAPYSNTASPPPSSPE